MSTYSGRRGPNVSEYIANLNTVPSAYELAQGQEKVDVEDDLALFMNGDFFDFDMGEIPVIPEQAFQYDPEQEQRSRRENASAFRYHNGKQDASALSGDFRQQFPDFQNFPNIVPAEPQSATSATFSPTQSNRPVYPTSNYAASSLASPVSPHATATATPNRPSNKRKLDALSDPASRHQAAIEEAARLAAEEDKRRRNTAASARFRVKKKQREQALERTAKEMTEKVSALESRVAQLEMENKWLKSLITEKNENKGDFAEMYKKFSKETVAANEAARNASERTDGVGTDKEGVEKGDKS